MDNEDDEGPPAFPAIMWIPGLQWTLHGAVLAIYSLYHFIEELCNNDPFAVFGIILGAFGCVVGLMIFLCGLGILRGYEFSIHAVRLFSTFLGILGLLVCLVRERINNFFATESVLFLGCGIIAILYSKSWLLWQKQRYFPCSASIE